MKILFLTTHLNFGGISAYVVSLAAEFKKRGHSPVVASSGGDLLPLLEKENIKHFKVPLKTKSELSPKILPAVFKLSRFIRREKIDVIHAQTRVSQAAAFILSKLTGAKFVTTCHGFFKQNLGRKLWPCWGNGVIAISEAVREHLVNDFKVEKGRIFLIYNGIDTEKFKKEKPLQQVEKFKEKLGIDKEDAVVGIIARLNNVKGHRFLIEAAAQIIRSFKDIKFVIIGDGPEKINLVKQVKKLALKEYVIFMNSIMDTSLALKAFDIFVMPSVQEGLGLSILEAMASGLPVVASDAGGIYSLVKNGVNGLLVPPCDKAALAESISKLLKDVPLRKEMGRVGQRMAEENFSLKMMTDETLKFYENILR